MKKITGVVAIIALAVGLTWAAERASDRLGFAQQAGPATDEQRSGNEDTSPGNEGITPGNEGILPSPNAAPGEQAENEGKSPGPVELSAEVTSIEEDLARIEAAIESQEVLEEFTPSVPLSADIPVDWPTDI